MIGEDRRANSTGVNRVDADVVAPELQGRRLGQSPHSPLAGHVCGEPERGGKSGSRGDIDDRAAARLAHRGHYRADAQIPGGQIDFVTTELVGNVPPLLLEQVRDHDVRALGDEAARMAGAHSTGTARDDHCSIVETFHDCFSFTTRRVPTEDLLRSWGGAHQAHLDATLTGADRKLGGATTPAASWSST